MFSTERHISSFLIPVKPSAEQYSWWYAPPLSRPEKVVIAIFLNQDEYISSTFHGASLFCHPVTPVSNETTVA